MTDAPATPPAAPPATPPAAPPATPPAAPPVTPSAGEPPKAPASIAGEPPKEPAKSEPAAGPFDPKAIKIPDGAKVDEKAAAAFAEIINDSKLSSQDRGQRLIDLHNAALKAAGEASTAAWTDTTTKWVNEIKADTKIGGDKLPTTVATIAKAIDSLGAESAQAFRQALDITGAGNNPAVVRALHHFASLLTEGKHVSGSPPSSKPDTKELFFPNSPEMKGTA